MWCVASAPIVPLARDLDARLGMELSELAVHFRKLSAPLLTTPLPLSGAPAFLPQAVRAAPHNPTPLSGTPAFLPHTAHAAPHGPTPLSGKTRVFSAHRPRRSDSLRTCLRAFPHLRHFPPGCTPFPPRRHRCNGDLLPKTQKNEHRSLGSGARFGLLSGRHSAAWC